MKLKIFIFILIVLAVIWIIVFRPIKRTVEIQPTNIDEGIFLCVPVETSAVKWEIVLEKDLDVLKRYIETGAIPSATAYEDVDLVGKTPNFSLKNYLFFGNIFIIRGKLFKQKKTIFSKIDISVIDVHEWDIVKPVNRDADLWGIFYPRSWLVSFDFLNEEEIKERKEALKKFDRARRAKWKE